MIAKEILDIKLKRNRSNSKPNQKNMKTINRRTKLNFGSYVQLVLADFTQSKFTKRYKQQNTQEIFKIHSFKNETLPITCRLKDLSGKL